MAGNRDDSAIVKKAWETRRKNMAKKSGRRAAAAKAAGVDPYSLIGKDMGPVDKNKLTGARFKSKTRGDVASKRKTAAQRAYERDLQKLAGRAYEGKSKKKAAEPSAGFKEHQASMARKAERKARIAAREKKVQAYLNPMTGEKKGSLADRAAIKAAARTAKAVWDRRARRKAAEALTKNPPGQAIGRKGTDSQGRSISEAGATERRKAGERDSKRRAGETASRKRQAAEFDRQARNTQAAQERGPSKMPPGAIADMRGKGRAKVARSEAQLRTSMRDARRALDDLDTKLARQRQRVGFGKDTPAIKKLKTRQAEWEDHYDAAARELLKQKGR